MTICIQTCMGVSGFGGRGMSRVARIFGCFCSLGEAHNVRPQWIIDLRGWKCTIVFTPGIRFTWTEADVHKKWVRVNRQNPKSRYGTTSTPSGSLYMHNSKTMCGPRTTFQDGVLSETACTTVFPVSLSLSFSLFPHTHTSPWPSKRPFEDTTVMIETGISHMVPLQPSLER